MKCAICKKKIEETFLKKLVGTWVKDADGKKRPVCRACQVSFGNDKEKMLAEL